MTEATAPAKSHHQVPVVRIENIRIHPNADLLEIVDILGYQAVVAKGQFQTGDLAYYIFPDSVVPQKPEFSFLWEGRVFEGEVPERYRRIKARKLRKEWSEGLLMNLEHKELTNRWLIPENLIMDPDIRDYPVEEGLDISEVLGIYHYEPPEPLSLAGDCERGPRSRRWPHSFKGWFFYLLRKATFNYFDIYGTTDSGRENGPENGLPIYDVEAMKNHQGLFKNDEEVVITEKIHGSNFRATFRDGKFYVGSRKLWKKSSSGCVWRKAAERNPWLEAWCRENSGYVVYAEVVPTQDGYHYGTKPGEPTIFVFDVLKPNGEWVGWNELETAQFVPILDSWVPILDQRYFQENTVKSLADGPSKVPGANHRREGIVIRPVVERQVRGLGRLQLKVVSNEFLTAEK